jgi:hypothetical protein
LFFEETIEKNLKKYHATSWGQGFTGFHRVSQGFTGFHRVSQGFTGFHRVSQGFTGFHRVSQAFTGFHRLSQAFTGFHRVAQGNSFPVQFFPCATKLWLCSEILNCKFTSLS